MMRVPGPFRRPRILRLWGMLPAERAGPPTRLIEVYWDSLLREGWRS
jgi:hypothetical protein